MKIVINKCYGGFGLSKAAREQLIDCGHCERVPARKYFGKTYSAERLERALRDSSSYAPLVVGETLLVDQHDQHDQNRACPTLVAVVESMGNKSFGDHSSLRVIEIPDGVDFEIDEYDGVESVHEKHRSWS